MPSTWHHHDIEIYVDTVLYVDTVIYVDTVTYVNKQTKEITPVHFYEQTLD